MRGWHLMGEPLRVLLVEDSEDDAALPQQERGVVLRILDQQHS